MQHFTDPTYLRTIHDGLLSGAMHKDNSSTLPIGLIGIYEEALPPSSNVNERKKFLEFFGVWALLKKEVSAAFVARTLDGWTESHVLEYIGKYSKWFNSPVSGKYVLYHERLRSFVLSKLDPNAIANKCLRIVLILENAIKHEHNSEIEIYALEFYSEYIFCGVESSIKEEILKNSVSSLFRERQVEISNKFNWSRASIYNCIAYLNHIKDNRLSDYYLKLIELKHLEEESIIHSSKLFREKRYKLAIERLRNISYSGYSAQSKQYTGYILCLMELLDLNNGCFDRIDNQAIKELFADLEDKRLDIWWFMPTGLLLLIYIEAQRIGLDAKFLFNSIYLDCEQYIINARFKDFELKWLTRLIIYKAEGKFIYEKLTNFFNCIQDNYPEDVFEGLIQKLITEYPELELNRLVESSVKTNNYDSKLDDKKSIVLLEFQPSLAHQDFETQTALSIDGFIKSNSFFYIKSQLKEISKLLSQFTYGMHSREDRNDILTNIRNELIKIKKYDKALAIKADDRENGIIEVVKFIALNDSYNNALPYLEKLNNIEKQNKITLEIATINVKNGKSDEGIQLLKMLHSNITQHNEKEQNL